MKACKDLGRSDLELLRLLLADDEDRLTEVERNAFESMARRMAYRDATLTEAQRSWLDAVALRLDVALPAANLVSSGIVPRGGDVPLPEILKHRPLKPPGRA